MPEITVRYKSKRAKQALQDFAKYFEWELVEKKTSMERYTAKSKKQLPVNWATKPDVMALAGIWKDQPPTQEELRAKAWGKNH